MRIKSIPEDFLVQEIINLPKDLARKQQKPYTYFWLTKKNYTTMRAVQTIARACHTSFKRFRFAGTKDRNAITKQLVCAYKIPSEQLEKINLKDLIIEPIGYSESQMKLGDLQGNKFEIVVRDLTEKEIKIIKKNAKEISKKGFPNIFGEQRFSKGHTHLIGKAILQNKLEEAVKLILTFSGEDESPEANQAHQFAKDNWGDWSEIIAKFPRYMGLEKSLLSHLIRLPNDFAGALREIPKPIRTLYVNAYQSFLFNQALLQTQDSKLKTNLKIPGFEIKPGKDKFSKLITQQLKTDNLKPEDFRCSAMPELASPGMMRLARVTPKFLKLARPEDDELNKGKLKMKLFFELPKNTYATVLVDCLAK